MSNKKIDYRQIFIESIFIVFAVSLAFSLSEWRQGMKTKQLVKRVFQTLEDEVTTNKLALEKAYTYHSTLLSELNNGTHVINSFPVSLFNFDYTNDEKLASFIQKFFVPDLIGTPKDVKIKRQNGERYMIIGESVNRLHTRNDSIIVYGSGNIVLRSATLLNNAWQIANATNAVVEIDYDLILLMGKINNQILDYDKTVEKAITILYSEDGNIKSVLEDMRWMEKELLTRYESIHALTSR